MKGILRLGMLWVAAVALVGCETSADRKASREDASQAYGEGVAALEGGDFNTAVQKLSAALESGWLGYSTVNAYIKRAIAHAALGDFEAAQKDLDTAEQGEGLSSEYFVVQSYVFEKQGDAKQAKAAWSKARRMDRQAKKIKF